MTEGQLMDELISCHQRYNVRFWFNGELMELIQYMLYQTYKSSQRCILICKVLNFLVIF